MVLELLLACISHQFCVAKAMGRRSSADHQPGSSLHLSVKFYSRLTFLICRHRNTYPQNWNIQIAQESIAITSGKVIQIIGQWWLQALRSIHLMKCYGPSDIRGKSLHRKCGCNCLKRIFIIRAGEGDKKTPTAPFLSAIEFIAKHLLREENTEVRSWPWF